MDRSPGRSGYHRGVTERIADPQAVCPFVALDEDRDHRAPGPDHRHRCFAESPAAPRALAHQAAYCLSGSFAGCPTFVDWARREAAPVKVDAAARSVREAGSTRAAVPPSVGPTSRSGGSAKDWTAPPPWGSAAGAATIGAAAAGSAGPPVPEGSAAHGDADEAAFDGSEPVASGFAGDADDAPESTAAAPDDAPAFLAGRSARPAPTPAAAPTPVAAPTPTPVPAWDDGEPWNAMGDDLDLHDGQPTRVPVAAPRRTPVGYAPVAPGKSDRRAGSSRQGRGDASAPSWEEPRHIEEYPELKGRRGPGVPRLALYALAVLLVGAVLFIAPSLLKGIGEGGDEASPTPAASASIVPTSEPSPTPIPTPAQVVYTVKAGDSLSGIAAAYGVTVEDILAANPSITDPNKIAPGDKIVIPQPLPSEIVDGEITPAP
jgi:nucleoid-associated protein YgaU